jgi:hypothetical protein
VKKHCATKDIQQGTYNVYISEDVSKYKQKARYEMGILPYQPIIPVFSSTRLSTALFSTGLFYVLSCPPSLYSWSHVSLIYSTVCYCIFLLIEPGTGTASQSAHLRGRTGLAAKLLQHLLQQECSHPLTRIYINSNSHSTELNFSYMQVPADFSNSIKCLHSLGKDKDRIRDASLTSIQSSFHIALCSVKGKNVVICVRN